MQAVEKFDTLMSRTYQQEYKPSDDPINPFIHVVEHKLRPRLEEVHLRNRYRRTLSALLRSKPIPDMMDKTHSVLKTLHRYENGLQGKVSQAAPSKEHRQYAALRKGRDPRMNEPNAHFDRLEKENQGFNVGRHEGQRPSTAVLAWRPRNPFLTYEKPVLTSGQLQELEGRQLHAKIMNERVQIYNQQFVPDELLPSDCGWKREADAFRRRANSLEYPVMPKNQHCIAHDHSKDKKHQQKFKQVASAKKQDQQQQQNDEEDQKIDKQADDNGANQEAKAGEAPNDAKKDEEEKLEEDKMPSQILEEMRKSNIKDIIRNMTVHEQLRLLRHVIEDEEFKRREKLRTERESRREQQDIKQKVEQQIQTQQKVKEKAQQEAIGARRPAAAATSTAKKERRQNRQNLPMNADLVSEGEEQGQAATQQQATNQCTCDDDKRRKRKKRLDEMTYEELVDQKPSDVIEAAEEVDCDGPLPLTEQNLSAMNNSQHRGWKVVSAVGGRARSRGQYDSSPDDNSRGGDENGPATGNRKTPKQIKFRNTAIDIDIVNEKKEADRLLAQGWNLPKQMDPEEIRKRQASALKAESFRQPKRTQIIQIAENSNKEMAKKVYQIVQRNQMVDTTVPPVPRLVMGNHAAQV